MSAAEVTRGTQEARLRILYHEAGHAVMAVCHNIPFESVVIESGGCGEVDIRLGPLDEAIEDQLVSKIIQWQEMYAAGAAAEMLVYGDHHETLSRRDKELYGQLQARFRPGKPPRWEEDVNHARRVLKRCDIETVGNALNERNKLSEEEVWKLLSLEIP